MLYILILNHNVLDYITVFKLYEVPVFQFYYKRFDLIMYGVWWMRSDRSVETKC